MTRETVVLLHGLGRTRRSMRRAAERLSNEGFLPVVLGYPSRRHEVERLASIVAGHLPEPAAGPLHFVTHSLGGIVLRALVAARRPVRLGRTVMLAPPNRGSALASRLSRAPGYRLVTGPVGRELGAERDSLPNRLPPVDYELGVVIGNRPMWARLFGAVRAAGDGVVGIEEASVEGMTDLVVVPCGHTFIMNDRGVLDQTVHFLRHGRFRRDAP